MELVYQESIFSEDRISPWSESVMPMNLRSGLVPSSRLAELYYVKGVATFRVIPIEKS